MLETRAALITGVLGRFYVCLKFSSEFQLAKLITEVSSAPARANFVSTPTVFYMISTGVGHTQHYTFLLKRKNKLTRGSCRENFSEFRNNFYWKMCDTLRDSEAIFVFSNFESKWFFFFFCTAICLDDVIWYPLFIIASHYESEENLNDIGTYFYT